MSFELKDDSDFEDTEFFLENDDDDKENESEITNQPATNVTRDEYDEPLTSTVKKRTVGFGKICY